MGHDPSHWQLQMDHNRQVHILPRSHTDDHEAAKVIQSMIAIAAIWHNLSFIISAACCYISFTICQILSLSILGAKVQRLKLLQAETKRQRVIL